MKTIVMGKKVKETYKVEVNQNEEGKLVSKPKIVLDDTDIKWEEILSYEGKPQYHTTDWYFITHSRYGKINISANEEVGIEKQIFRADLGDWIQYTDKVLDKKDNLKKCEKELASILRLYNTQKIEANPKAKSYCDIHKLDYAETDYEELMEIIDPDSCEVMVQLANITKENLNKVLAVEKGIGFWDIPCL